MFLENIKYSIFLFVIFSFSSCTAQSKYFAYESSEKCEDGLPCAYYTLEENKEGNIIYRITDLYRYGKPYLYINTNKIGAHFYWIYHNMSDDILEPNQYYSHDKSYSKLYVTNNDEAKRILNLEEINDKVQNDLFLVQNLSLKFWFPSELKRVNKIDYSKFSKEVREKINLENPDEGKISDN